MDYDVYDYFMEICVVIVEWDFVLNCFVMLCSVFKGEKVKIIYMEGINYFISVEQFDMIFKVSGLILLVDICV